MSSAPAPTTAFKRLANPPKPVAEAFLCGGCDTLYRTQPDCEHHVRVFACGPCVPQYVSVGHRLIPPCSHERPYSMGKFVWSDAVTARCQQILLVQTWPERPAPGDEAGLQRFASWWAEQPVAYKEAHASAPVILYARRHGFL